MAEHYNYIAFGNRNLIDGKDISITMGRGRMFEYTPTEIANGLVALDVEAVSYLKNLPTFLCSEIVRFDDYATIIVKFGRILNISVESRQVNAEFIVLHDFGNLSFNTVEDAEKIFSMDDFQLYRTHWAVRKGNIDEILESLSRISTKGSNPQTRIEIEETQSANALPPKQKKKIIGTANNVESFLKILQDRQVTSDTETFYRGHENQNFELTPSLLRKSPNGQWQYMPFEDRLCKELLIAHYDDFQSDQYCFDRLVRMQHYGLPTRLLDISSNPLVALFFACSSSKGLMGEKGEVIIFNVSSNFIKYYDSDTVSCISNLSNLTYEQKNNIDLTKEVSEFNETDVAKKLLHHIKSEKGFFEPKIIPENLGSILCVKAKRTNTRIKSQSGAFLLFGHEVSLPEDGADGIEVSRITIENKEEILKQLDAININATTVYPSIDQTAGNLRKRYLQSS